MRRLRALDLFCGGGGASVGLVEAGFDVVGVDHRPQDDYPAGLFGPCRFVLADALTYPLDGFDLIWASPPCQRYSTATQQSGDPDLWPDLVEPVRERLVASGAAWVIENVPGAPLIDPVTLCGSMFGLGVIRHRLFETSFPVSLPEHRHAGSLVAGDYVTVTGNGGVPEWTMREREKRGLPRHYPGEMSIERWRSAMGIDWMRRESLVQAIPPAYARHLAEQFIDSRIAQKEAAPRA